MRNGATNITLAHFLNEISKFMYFQLILIPICSTDANGPSNLIDRNHF